MATSSSWSYRPAGCAAAGRGVFEAGSIFNLAGWVLGCHLDFQFGLGAGLSSCGV